MLLLPRFNSVGERLLWARNRAGLTQEELADLSCVSRDVIAKTELGKTKRPKRMKELAEVLKVPPAWLAFGDERIDTWDNDTLQFAQTYHELPPTVRDAVKTLVNSLSDASTNTN